MNATSTTATSSNSTVADFDEADLQNAVEQHDAEGKTVIVENKSAEKLVAEVQRLFPEITMLEVGKSSNKEIVHKLNEVVDALNKLSVAQPAPQSNSASRDRGPVSERTATEDDARKFMLGEYSALSHKDAAAKLGLSYGQVYSARKGFTFKAICKEAMAAGKKW